MAAFVYIAFSLGPDVTFLRLLPGLVLYGLGFGLSIAQLTNVVLSDVTPGGSGAAGGANNTARQVGFAIGIAVIGTLLSSRTIAAAVDRVQGSAAHQPARAGRRRRRHPARRGHLRAAAERHARRSGRCCTACSSTRWPSAPAPRCCSPHRSCSIALALTFKIPTPPSIPLDVAAVELADEELGV